MDTHESTLARLKIEDRLGEANRQRRAHEFHRRELSSSTPTALCEPGAHGPSDLASAGQGLARGLVRSYREQVPS